MSTTLFEFQFTATCYRNDKPFVARIQWDAAKKTLVRHYFPLEMKPSGRFYATATCTFTAAAGDIIETNRGRSKDREFRSFNLVAPTGYLILVAISDEVNDVMSVMNYLAGTASVSELAKGRWSFHAVTSDWKGTAMATGRPAQATASQDVFLKTLTDSQRALELELSQVRALINDKPVTPATKARSRQSKFGPV